MPLRERQDVPDRVVPEAIAAIRELIDHRAQPSTVFDDPDACVESIARFSGGRLRDALLVARTAAEFSDPAPIGVTHIEKAARRIGSAFLTKPESWPRLAQIHRDKQVADTSLDHELLKHSLVLIYDGEPWWDVHPLVRLDARFTSAWQTLAGS